ncbi:MAG: DEAD/DEAH box helicase [Anaerolineales bacterium]
MGLDRLLDRWRADPQTGPHFAAWRSLPPRPADLRPVPADLPAALTEMLRRRGLERLYSHQVEAWEAARRGENLVLSTGTASGKTLAYNLPVLAALLEDPQARALYLFPTKALAQDQSSILSGQLSVIRSPMTEHCSLNTGIYDGDTPQGERKSIRERARLVFTNPDMLHTGILPHHTNWEDFFRHLRFVVIDEMHTYRGVFGSHVANVLRRLKRVAQFYGASPQFILTSATIGNPRQLAERLIEAPVRLIDRDGSGRGPRHFLIYNPPVVDPALGLRKSALLESVRLSQEIHAEGLQQVVFVRSRRSVELLLTYLQQEGERKTGHGNQPINHNPSTINHPPSTLRGYRSGYLPSQRREIERGLRDGSVRTVVATNALELGIDIGGLEVALLVGYPGTVASARQQAGRAGRGSAPAAALLVASSGPIDQYLARYPDYLFDRSPEQALINPDHLLILLAHLRCAMFELPFTAGETFGALNVDEFLEFLVANREAHRSQGKYYWMADSYPAATISLRSASPETFVLQAADGGRQTADGRPQTVGVVDGESALWMAHPGAVYLHEAQPYLVERLDLEQKVARLRPFDGDYFTEPLKQTTIQVLSVGGQEVLLRPNSDEITHAKGWGELQVTTQVVGFRKLRWYSRENLGEEALDLPPSDLQTTGYWLSISEATVERLSRAGLWTNAPNDYGPGWSRIRDAVRARDGYRCQVCGRPEEGRRHDVHHKIPFRMFRDEAGRILREKANDPANLVTLCPECHRQAEANVRIRSGLAGLAYVLGNLAPLFLMCDPGDLGTHIEPTASAAFPQPTVVLYDLVPAGIGFSQSLYEMHTDLLGRALDLVEACPCEDGCPSCVGPGGENGAGGKQETVALLRILIRS